MRYGRLLEKSVFGIFGLALVACGGDSGGTGSLEVTVWGEEIIEEGIPADAFEDAWSMRYDKFLIVLGDVTLARTGESGELTLDGMTLFDLTESGPLTLGRIPRLEEGHWDEVSFASLTADAETRLSDSATTGDLHSMIDAGYNVFASGTATQGDEEKRFAWGFSEPTVYASCASQSGGQQTFGVSIGDGTETTMELTIHGDHLFYDDLTSPDANLRFDVIASADVDGDDEVTLAELAEVRLAELSSEQGSYGVGAADINDMGEFVAAATTSLGHFNGEGHCLTERP